MSQEREDYAEGLDDLTDNELRGATRDFVLLVAGSVLVLWIIAGLVARGLLR